MIMLEMIRNDIMEIILNYTSSFCDCFFVSILFYIFLVVCFSYIQLRPVGTVSAVAIGN